MSVVETALRISAVKAVEASGIFSPSRVYDSAFLPVDKVSTENPEPFLIISTETGTSNPSGRDTQAGDWTIDFVLEFGLSKAIAVSVPDDEDEIELQLVDTDAGLEASMAILIRQVMTCLFGRGGGEWGEVFRSLNSQIKEVVSRRGVSASEGSRFAARQITQTLQMISDPPYATPLIEESPLFTFLALAEADAQLQAIAQALRNAIEGVPQDWPAVYNAAAVMGGYTDSEADKLGLGLLEPEEAPPLVSEITVSEDGGEDFVINDETVDEEP